MCEVVARYEGSAVNGIRPIEIGRLISVSLDRNILETTGAKTPLCPVGFEHAQWNESPDAEKGVFNARRQCALQQGRGC